MYYYADRQDKAGRRLITSYGKEAQARKYGGANARVDSKQRRMVLREDGTASMSTTGTDGLLLRTFMSNPNRTPSADEGGKFVVYGKIGDKWERTSFSYKTYATANSAVKSALINMYDACAIVEDEGDAPSAPQSDEEEVDLDEAPF